MAEVKEDVFKPPFWKSALAGTFAGFGQVLSGQPFDTIKVRLQSGGNQYSGMMDCVTKTIRNEGAMALYKGTLSPLAGVGLCVSIQFAAVEQMKAFFAARNRSPSDPLTWSQHYLCGAVAGVANSIVSGPVEQIRSLLQVQSASKSSEAAFHGPVDAVKKIYSSYGFGGIYRGQLITILREFQGYGGYFLAYEFAVSSCLKEGQKLQDLNPLVVMMCGAIGGYGMWIPVYPIDFIKSKLQTDVFGSARKYNGIVDCVQKTWYAEGIRGFYRGFLPCLLRAAPVNACTFLAYELSMRVLGR